MSLTKVKAGNILLTTPSSSSNDTTPATTQYVTTAIGNLVDTAPSTLNTLNELAAALGDDVNFSTTVTNSIATKLPLAGGSLTGALDITSGGNQLTLSRSGFDNILFGTGTVNNQVGFHITNSTDSVVPFSLHENAPAGTMVIDASGNVGIGTDSPAGPLHVDGHTGSVATILEGNGNGDTVPLHFRTKANNGNVTNYGIFGNAGSTGTGNTILIGPTNSSGLTVNSSGNVGIGTASPTMPLSVQAASNAYAISMHGRSDGYSELYGASNDGSTKYSFLQSHSAQTKLYTLVNTPLLFGTNSTERMRLSAAGDLQLESGAVNKGYLQLSTQSNLYALMGGNYWGYLGYKTGGYHRWFGSDGVEDMRIATGGNVGIGEPNPDAILTIGSTGYVQEWKYAKGFKKNDTGQSGANGNYSESTVINVASYRGVCVDYYESGHYFNNGAAYYFRHSKIYVIMEGSTFRVSDVVLQRSMGNRTDAIVSAPSLSTSGAGQFTITSTILSGFTHYVSVDAVGGGFVSIGSIG
jgi:hypothetical protein